MPKLVPVQARVMLKILRVLGFDLARIRGSHHFFLHPLTRKSTVVPVHAGELLGVGLLRSILRDIELPVDQYDKLRRTV
jgi:predicted RNA binding protein YcfA (HicA-like mRNA interferase family)